MDSRSAFLIAAIFFFTSGTTLSVIFIHFARKTAKPAKRKAPAYHPTTAKTAAASGLMEKVDQMNGAVFKQFCAELLEYFGYNNIHITKSARGQGVDIIAVKHGLRYAFQCKRYSSKIGNSAIQEINTGTMLYSCSVGVVITNGYFTAGAVQAAKEAGVELWDRDVLMEKLDRIAP